MREGRIELGFRFRVRFRLGHYGEMGGDKGRKERDGKICALLLQTKTKEDTKRSRHEKKTSQGKRQDTRQDKTRQEQTRQYKDQKTKITYEPVETTPLLKSLLTSHSRTGRRRPLRLR
jgi:hypothetical protein